LKAKFDKIIAILAVIIIAFTLRVDAQLSPITGNAAKCFPDYECGIWGDCDEGLQSRICQDQRCDRRDIVERRFCHIPGCRPEIECLEWSECIYTEKIENLIEGKIGFGGYHNRICRDVNGCVDSFTEEKACEEFFLLRMEKVVQCDKNLLVAIDPVSEREIAKIDLDSWSENRLDIVFTQGEQSFCPPCFNGIMDLGEDDIDCGGECKACTERIVFPAKIAMIAFWILSALFSLLFVREIILLKKTHSLTYKNILK